MTVECPTCGQQCSTENGMKNHHAKVHGESLALVKVECHWCGVVEEEYESQLGLFGDNWYCQRSCYDKAQSQRRQGRSLEENIGEEGAQKVKEHMAELGRERDNSGENNPMYGTTRNPSEETIEKIREGNLGKEPPMPQWMYDEELDHFTRSGWEREFGAMLVENGVEYEYEGVEVDLKGGGVHRPDFVISDSDVIAELKGRIWNDDTAEKSEAVMNQKNQWIYIVVGASLPCDYHYDWEDRQSVLDHL